MVLREQVKLATLGRCIGLSTPAETNWHEILAVGVPKLSTGRWRFLWPAFHTHEREPRVQSTANQGAHDGRMME